MSFIKHFSSYSTCSAHIINQYFMYFIMFMSCSPEHLFSTKKNYLWNSPASPLSTQQQANTFGIICLFISDHSYSTLNIKGQGQMKAKVLSYNDN